MVTQILEKTLERQREELRKEKEDHRLEKAKRLTREKAIMDKVKNVEQVGLSVTCIEVHDNEN